NRHRAGRADTMWSDITDTRPHPYTSDVIHPRGGPGSTNQFFIHRRMPARQATQLGLVVPFVVRLVAAQESPIVSPSEGFGDARQDVPVGSLLVREGSLFLEGDLPFLNNRVLGLPELTFGETLLEGIDGLLKRCCSPSLRLSQEGPDLLLLALRYSHHGGYTLLDKFEIRLVRLELLFRDLEAFRMHGRLLPALSDLSCEIPRVSPVQEVGEDRNN